MRKCEAGKLVGAWPPRAWEQGSTSGMGSRSVVCAMYEWKAVTFKLERDAEATRIFAYASLCIGGAEAISLGTQGSWTVRGRKLDPAQLAFVVEVTPICTSPLPRLCVGGEFNLLLTSQPERIPLRSMRWRHELGVGTGTCRDVKRALERQLQQQFSRAVRCGTDDIEGRWGGWTARIGRLDEGEV